MIIGVEPKHATLPTVKLTLQNFSEKAMNAFSFELLQNGKTQLSGMPQGQEGKVLIAPGAKYEMALTINHRPNQNGEADSLSPSKQTIVIKAVVFEDDTFEGEPDNAASFLGAQFGRKLQLLKL
jgi:hypothetical protein